MINIEIDQVFVGYVVALMIFVIIWWLRLIIATRNNWKSYEDQVFQCRHCDYKFIVNALDEKVKCPNCQDDCELRWGGKKRRKSHDNRHTSAKSSK